MENDDDILYNNSEKLKYIFQEVLSLKNTTVAKETGFSSDFLSKLFNHSTGKLKKQHLLALSHQYDIPMEIFEDGSIDSKVLIKSRLEEIKKEVFQKNTKVLKKLAGDWYAYTYASNSLEVNEVKTMFTVDGHVIDEHENEGYVHTGKNQSWILKETENTQNINSITFDNSRVTYGIFVFSLVSKVNNENRELFNFGVYSRNRLELEKVKEILGEKDTVQLKVKPKVLERINKYSVVS